MPERHLTDSPHLGAKPTLCCTTNNGIPPERKGGEIEYVMWIDDVSLSVYADDREECLRAGERFADWLHSAARQYFIDGKGPWMLFSDPPSQTLGDASA